MPTLPLATNAARIAETAGSAAAMSDPYVANSTHRVRDGEEIGRAIADALGVVEALTEPTGIVSGHGFIRQPGALAAMTRAEQEAAIIEVAQTVARHRMSTSYANSGGTRMTCADRIAQHVLDALFAAGLLALAPKDA